jgi:hypothetical protein
MKILWNPDESENQLPIFHREKLAYDIMSMSVPLNVFETND